MKKRAVSKNLLKRLQGKKQRSAVWTLERKMKLTLLERAQALAEGDTER